MHFAMFASHLSEVLRLPRKREATTYKVLHLSCKGILGKLKIWCSKLQPLSGTLSADLQACLTHMSLVLRLPREMQIVFKPPTPAMIATKPSRFTHFWQNAESIAPATKNNPWTSKSANKVHFLNIATAKSAPNPAPQRRALFQHLKVQKCSDTEAFCTSWLRHVLRARTACTFSISQRPKVLRRWDAFCILTFKFGSRCSGVQFLISQLPRWLRTRRFSEPTFRPFGATKHWKNRTLRHFSTFSLFCTCPYCRKFDFQTSFDHLVVISDQMS